MFYLHFFTSLLHKCLIWWSHYNTYLVIRSFHRWGYLGCLTSHWHFPKDTKSTQHRKAGSQIKQSCDCLAVWARHGSVYHFLWTWNRQFTLKTETCCQVWLNMSEEIMYMALEFLFCRLMHFCKTNKNFQFEFRPC